MAKPAETPGSDRSELKRLLKLAVDKPLPMAFALGQDGKAIIKLDKLKPPRSLEKGLKEDAAGSRNHRFGTVVVDAEDPTIVKFIVNKEITGIARKLVVALKGTGFKKVTLLGEDGMSLEEHEEEDEELEVDVRPSFAAPDDGEDATLRAEPETPAPDDQAPAPPADMAAPDTATPDATAPEAAPAGAGPDAASLTRQLAGLVKQMLAVIAKDPSQKSALAELATDAQLSIKRGQLGEAAAGIEVLQMAIASASDPDMTGGDPVPADGSSNQPPVDVAPSVAPDVAPQPPAQTAPPAPPDPAVTTRLRKSRVAWTATRAKVDDSLGKLVQAIMQAGEGEDMGSSLEDQFYAAVSPTLEELDSTLAEALDNAADATGDERDAALSEVRDTISQYSSFVQGNDVIRLLDSNPFMQVNLAKTLTATLDTLSRSVG